MNTNMSEKAELAASLSKTQQKVENNKQKLADKVNQQIHLQ